MGEKYAVVTGAGKGIGAAIAERLAVDGYDIVINYSRSQGPAETLARNIEQTYGKRALTFKADVSNYDEVKAMRDYAVENLGENCKVLVNNAGFENGTMFLDMTPKMYQKLISVDLFGSLHCTHLFAPLMVEKKEGCIIMIASTAGLMGSPLMVDYSAAKGGQIAMAKALAQELGQYNISVVSIAPGFIKTEGTAARGPELLEMLKQQSPMGRVGEVEEIAEMVSYIVKAPIITGQVLVPNYGTYLN